MITPVQTPDLPALARRLWNLGAVLIDLKDGFRLARHRQNGNTEKPSPYKFNFRIPENGGPLTFAEVLDIARFMHELIRKAELEFDAIAGVPEAGVPFAKELQHLLYEHDHISVELIPFEKSGSKTLSRRGLPRGARVLLVDDGISDAGSKLKIIEHCEREGFEVFHCVVFFNREEGGEEALLARDVRLYAAVTAKEFFRLLFKQGLVEPPALAAVLNYINAQ